MKCNKIQANWIKSRSKYFTPWKCTIMYMCTCVYVYMCIRVSIFASVSKIFVLDFEMFWQCVSFCFLFYFTHWWLIAAFIYQGLHSVCKSLFKLLRVYSYKALALKQKKESIIRILLYFDNPIYFCQVYIQWNLSKPNHLGTNYCGRNRQVFGLYRLN